MTVNGLHTIGKAGAGFRSLADAWADTTTPRLVGFAKDFVRPCQFEPTTCRRPGRRTAGAPSHPRSSHRSDAVGGGGTLQVGTICRVAAN